MFLFFFVWRVPILCKIHFSVNLANVLQQNNKRLRPARKLPGNEESPSVTFFPRLAPLLTECAGLVISPLWCHKGVQLANFTLIKLNFWRFSISVSAIFYYVTCIWNFKSRVKLKSEKELSVAPDCYFIYRFFFQLNLLLSVISFNCYNNLITIYYMCFWLFM